MNGKQLVALTLTTLSLCMALTACGNGTAGNAQESGTATSSSAGETEKKFLAGVLEQNSVETASRKNWIASSATGEVRKQVEYKPFSSLNTMLMELNAGRVDYLRLPLSVGTYLLSSDATLKLTARDAQAQHYHMAARAEDSAFCKELSSAIDSLKADGTLEKLTTYYITKANGAPAANTLSKHEGGETHVVAITGDLPPLDYVSADGTPAGFNVALLNAISEKTGCNFELVQLDAAARLSALQSGKVDLIFWIGCYSSEGFEPEAEGICLTNPYFEEPTCLVSASQDTLDQAMKIYQTKK